MNLAKGGNNNTTADDDATISTATTALVLNNTVVSNNNGSSTSYFAFKCDTSDDSLFYQCESCYITQNYQVKKGSIAETDCFLAGSCDKDSYGEGCSDLQGGNVLPEGDDYNPDNGLSGGQIAGIIIGVFAAVAVIAVGIGFLLVTRKKQSGSNAAPDVITEGGYGTINNNESEGLLGN